MDRFIQFCISRKRTVLLLLTFFVVGGYSTYITIPKESFPDITIPVALVNLKQKGISPEDAERLLVKPIETKLQSLEGLKDISAEAYEGGGHVFLEFQAGLNPDQMLRNVQDEVDKAKADLPDDSDEPIVKEINPSLFPVLVVQLSGEVPMRALYKAADDIKDEIEGVSQVLKATILGKRKEVVEVNVDPFKLETYGLSLQDLPTLFSLNNRIVKSGRIDNGTGEIPIKVPGLIQSVADVYMAPLLRVGQIIVRFKDLATVRSTFEMPTTIARDRGKAAVAIEVVKRTGQNIIETIQGVRKVVDGALAQYGGRIHVTYAQDGSQRIRDQLIELQNSIISAVLLVMLIIILAMGLRSSLLVGIAIPGAFLMGVFALGLMGYTINMVVLFGLILSVGMLVDGAIIVVEYADRKMIEGYDREAAYRAGAIRMAWPVITSIVTVLVVFLPLLQWPGVVGKFMRFLPITLIATLTASLLMALIFIPVLGTIFGKVTQTNQKIIQAIIASERGAIHEIGGITGRYVRLLQNVLANPIKVILGAFSLLVVIVMVYKQQGRGVEFFPNIEAEKASFLVRARGNLSIYEKDALVQKVESHLLKVPEFKTVYAKTGSVNNGPLDSVGEIIVEFIDWKKRSHADMLLERVLQDVSKIPGIEVEVSKDKPGPSKGKAVDIRVLGQDREVMKEVVLQIRNKLESMDTLIDIEDNLPLPGIEWQLKVKRDEALKYGANIASVGSMVQLLTKGLVFGTYRPDHTDEEVDIVVRYPEAYRNLSQLQNLRLKTDMGNVPIRNFVDIIPQQKTTVVRRLNGKPSNFIRANLADGVLLEKPLAEFKAWLAAQKLPGGVSVILKGEEEDSQETAAFLKKAFGVALFLILLILVTQFNSFFSAFLVLSSVVLSTFGVIVGLLVMGQPFGIVMGGLGVIALAGIIVSNNIILIDTFDHLRKNAHTLEEVREAIIRTGAQRLRPVVMTKLTTILGLIPILLRLDINFIEGSLSMGAPSSEWWVQLSTAVIFGVAFASVLTLLVTPAALMIKENIRFARARNR